MVMMMRTFGLAIALLMAGACADKEPTGPTTAVVNLVYVPPAAPASCPLPGAIECYAGCAHHYAPSNLRVSASWGADQRLTACGEAYCVVLPGAPIDRELTVLLIDIAQCCRDCSAAVRETVSVNGTRLTRFVEGTGGQAGGLAFRIDRNGRVRP